MRFSGLVGKMINFYLEIWVKFYGKSAGTPIF